MERRTVAELSRALRDREVTSRALTERCLGEIERLDRTLNAFITVTADRALAAAAAADGRLAQGPRAMPAR